MKGATRQYRNQRLQRPGRQRRQQHLLEVSVRRDRERAIRFRTAAFFFLKLVVYVALIAGLVIGGKEGFRRYVWENPYFFMEDLRVHTDGTLTRDQILIAAGVSHSMNFFQLRLGQVRKGLEALPQVERVTLNRELPNKLTIDINERQPIAWLTDRADFDPSTVEGSYLIDSRGYIMTSKKRRQDFLHLPVICGAVLEDYEAGQKATALEIQAALELIRLNADSMRWQVRTVDVAKGYCLVVTDRSRARITFGLDDVDRQLTRLYRIIDYIEPSHREIQTVNLLVERNTPVTFMDEPAVLASSAETPPEEVALAKIDKPVADKSGKGKIVETAALLPHSTGGFTKPVEVKATPTPAAAKTRNSSSSESRSRESSHSDSSSSRTLRSGGGRKKTNESVKKPFRANG